MSQSLREDGSAHLPLIIFFCMLSLAGTYSLKKMVMNELDTVKSFAMHSDKSLVKSHLEHNIDCNRVPASNCQINRNYTLYNEQRDVLLSRTGNTSIANWNTRLRCVNDGGPQLEFQVSKKNGQEFLKDPLNKKTLSWQPLLRLSEVCGSQNNMVLLGSTPCYGSREGRNQMPREIREQCTGACAANPDNFKYCTDDQRSFPECPDNFVRTLIYVDRYGWGGRDLSKYSQCKPI